MGTHTGPYPSSPKDPHEFAEKEISKQNGFRNSKMAQIPFKRMTQDTAMDPFPAAKTNRDGTDSHGGTTYTKAGRSDLTVPTKARPFGPYVTETPPPKGRALPVRGEHND